jgi:hypothetical protein
MHSNGTLSLIGDETSVGLLCTGSQFNVRRVNILHRVGYQMDIRNVSLCCISLLQDAIPVQHWMKHPILN